MYSLVLATALTAGTTAPDCWYGFWCGPPCPPAPCCWCPPPCYPMGALGNYGPAAPVYYLSPPYYWWGPSVPASWGPGYGPATFDWAGLEGPMPNVLPQFCGKVTVLAPREVEVAFNGMKIKRKSERQSFDTPKLKAGEKFHYVVTATVVVDGKKETLKRTVVVEAGKKSEADFRELALVLAKK